MRRAENGPRSGAAHTRRCRAAHVSSALSVYRQRMRCALLGLRGSAASSDGSGEREKFQLVVTVGARGGRQDEQAVILLLILQNLALPDRADRTAIMARRRLGLIAGLVFPIQIVCSLARPSRLLST